MNENSQEGKTRHKFEDQSEIKNILNSEINFNNNFHSNKVLTKQENKMNLSEKALNSKSSKIIKNNFSNNYNNNDNNDPREINTKNPKNNIKFSDPQINSHLKMFGNQATSKFKSANNPKLVKTGTNGILFFAEKNEAPNERNVEEHNLNGISDSHQKLYENANTNNLKLNNYLDNNIKQNDNNLDNFKFNDSNLNKFMDKNNDLNSNFKKQESKLGIENKAKVIPANENPPINMKRSVKKIISEMLDKNITALIMSIATIYALILSDLNIIFFSPDVDIIFSILSGIVFILILVEFVLSTSTKEDNNGTFFFWLDLLSILSMILNIDWIIYPFLEFFSETTSTDSAFTNIGLQKVMRNLSGVVRLTRYFKELTD